VYSERGYAAAQEPAGEGQTDHHVYSHLPIDNWLPAKKMRQLEELLPDREEQIIPDGADECSLEDDLPHAGAGHSAHYQADSDEEGYAPRVQCASQ
jgi:hypothetical protein